MSFRILLLALVAALQPALAQDAVPGPKTFTRKKERKTAPIPMEKRVDINSATREQLMKLPKVNAEAADKIIAARPYKSKVHLVSHGIISQGLYDLIKGRIIAKQP